MQGNMIKNGERMICPKCDKKFYSWRLIYLTPQNYILCPNCKTQLNESRGKSHKIMVILGSISGVLPYLLFDIILNIIKFNFLQITIYIISIWILSTIIHQFTIKLKIKEDI